MAIFIKDKTLDQVRAAYPHSAEIVDVGNGWAVLDQHTDDRVFFTASADDVEAVKKIGSTAVAVDGGWLIFEPVID